MSVGTILARTIGAAALGITAYESVKIGHKEGIRHTVDQETDYLTDVFINNQMATSMSPIKDKLKSWWAESLLDSSIVKTVMGARNIVMSVAKELIYSPITIGLGALALLTGTKSQKPVLKQLGKMPILGKIAAGLLALQAIKVTTFDVMGFGKESKL